MNTHNKALAYVMRIRNEAKKQYAAAYLDYLISGERGQSPDHRCSYIAAQAVRAELEKLLEVQRTTT